MRTWKDLEEDFRALLEFRQDALLEHQYGAEGERWDVKGPSPEQITRFESLSTIAGAKVRDLAASTEWPGVTEEKDAKIRWYRCLKHFSPNYKAEAMVVSSSTPDGQSKAHTYFGHLNRVFAESSTLCVRMETFTVAPRLRLEALAAAPRYAGVWQHWSAVQATLGSSEPNLAKAVADAVHAVEGLARVVLHDSNVILSVAVKEMREKRGLHATLANSIDKVYAYAGDVGGIRHGAAAVVQVKPEEARFAIDVCEAALVLMLALDTIE